MKNIFLIVILLFFGELNAQLSEQGTIAGKLTDRELLGEPLSFANVIIKGTNIGTTSDLNGLFALEDLAPGQYTLIFSFLGYETIEVPDVKVLPGKVTEINTSLGASAASLEEVVITTVARKDSPIALLLEQKRAVQIKASIGAQELAKLGVSDAGTATTKISGVSSSEASGDIYVRGLGDRYLYTTINGLPVPSDEVERKNIDLSLFSTALIENISISKTFSAETSADQASGNIDINSRQLVGKNEFKIGVESGINLNVAKKGIWNDFKASANAKDISFGFYYPDLSTRDAITGQSWNTARVDFPVNYKYSLTAGRRFGEKTNMLFTGSQSVSFRHQKGVFREFRSNFINDFMTDAETFEKNINTTALLNFGHRINENNRLNASSIFINKVSDEIFEGGRNGEAVIFEETQPSEGLSQFVRDQNTKQVRLWINQLLGSHQLNDQNELDWALGYNLLDAEEPNRIRNEINFNNEKVQFGRTGGFQQRKSSQIINDREFNGLIKDKIILSENYANSTFLSIGGSFRNKERELYSRFFGVEEGTINSIDPGSIDELSEVFTEENFLNNKLILRVLKPDVYQATLNSAGGFASFNYGLEKWNLNLGLRYQRDEISVKYDVGNIPGRTGSSSKHYSGIYPALNLKYSLNEKQNLRFSGSKTISLPEFKEIAPFEYVSQTGQVTRGNPDLKASTNYNLDVKWEFFPTAGEIASLTGFYKKIMDPINKVQDRGSAGVFSYFNSGNEAEVYGLEAEIRMDLLPEAQNENFNLDLSLNATRMWHRQDLKVERTGNGDLIRTFRYKGLEETGLQGASDWIFNGSVIFATRSEDPFQASLAANYASDRIFALGAPEIQTRSESFYNDEIIEKGFVSLDALLQKDFGEHFSLKITGENLLNPEIKRTQLVKPVTSGVETERTIRSYSRGSIFSLGVSYEF